MAGHKSGKLYSVTAPFAAGFAALIFASSVTLEPGHLSVSEFNPDRLVLASDTDSVKTIDLPYPFTDQSNSDPMYRDESPLFLNDPSNIKTIVTFDPDSNMYIVEQKMGSIDYRPPSYMTVDEYMNWQKEQHLKEYWKQKTHADELNSQNGKKGFNPKLHVKGQVFQDIFGGNTVDIRPQGSAELTFGVNISKTDNPSIPEKQRRLTTFDFNEKIQLNVIGKIGEKLKLTTSYNTEATFDYENQMKLEFTGFEDDIIKKIEAGNVSLPLSGTLITGSTSLFGIKTQLQFGKVTVTNVFSQQKGKKSEIEITGGAQTSNFEVNGDNYEANKHYFLSQWFRDHYESALATLPGVASNINVNKVEVWITNTTSSITDTRHLIAFTDLGEEDSNLTSPLVIGNLGPVALPNTTPGNSNNGLNPSVFPVTYPQVRDKNQVAGFLTSPLNFLPVFEAVRDFEKVISARKLTPSEYYVNEKLGFISLNTQLNPDQVLAVAFQYTVNGDVFQVGEFSTDGVADSSCILVKLLKSTNVSTRRDTLMWDLMMKNVYAIGAYQVKAQDFKLDVLYNNPSSGTYVNVLPENNLGISGQQLIQVLNLDNMNTSMNNTPDGMFDFLDKITINASNGRVYLPAVEPFGDYLRKQINPTGNVNLVVIENKYAYDQLYDSSKTAAQQFPDKNRFLIRGSYKSASGSEISLNAANVPQGSVMVTAGGVPLIENQDYTVDYALGKVKIINEGILQSGTPIKISLESNSLFSIQSKTMIGTRIDYRVSRDFNLGFTHVRLNEKPLTQKVNIGDEPIKNNVVGIDGNYRTEAPWLTRLVDKLPLYATKEISTITTSFEGAKLFPGHSKAIGKDGNSYIDDFEGSQTNIDIKSVGAWTLASVPQLQPTLFPEAADTGTSPGMNRALLSWYVIDPILLRTTQVVTNTNQQSNNLTREILETELFPNKQSPTGQPINIPTLDLSFYPQEPGPYNYNVDSTFLASGLDINGKLKDPASRWAGIMRKIETNDFEAANVEYIQFWLMDPFVRDANGTPTDYTEIFPSYNVMNNSGDLYINIGNVSEDILKDGRKSFENGLPNPNNTTLPTIQTSWGNIPTTTSIVNAFDNTNDGRRGQDIGLDGLADTDPLGGSNNETNFFDWYLGRIAAVYGTSSTAYQNMVDATGENGDVSHDYYHHYRGDYDDLQYDIIRRYKYYNGMEGNSPVESGDNGYTQSSTTIPNTEDVNRDNNLNETESYYQYRIRVNPTDINPNNVGNNYITNVYQSSAPAPNGQTKVVYWYQFKIPLSQFQKVGNIEDFKSIRFFRMYMKGFQTPMVMRFAKLDLVRGEWRKYAYDLLAPGDYQPNDNGCTTFDISGVNYEENGSKQPVNYVLPPDIEQETDITTANLVKLNEQALALRTCCLKDGDSRACYKNVSLDVRSYKKMKMFVHAEAGPNNEVLNDGDVTLFVRLGTDYTSNYYEYEIPLYVTAPGYYSNTSDDDKRRVWRFENDLIMNFADLQSAKQERNSKMAISTSGVSLTTEYLVTIQDEQGNTRFIRVKGNPNLSTIKTIMIGVRNKKKIAGDGDDGLSKCTEVWVNELRLTDFDEIGGWAATGRITAKLADLGSITLAGNISTPGWGSLEKKVSERKKETVLSYDIITQVELGKFFPTGWNIRVPLYYGFSETRINPQFNPYDPDIELSNVYSNTEFSDAYKDSIRNSAQDYTRRKSINLTNVKKERGKDKKKTHFYDVENLALNLSYSEIFQHNYSVAHYLSRDYRGGITYNFNTQPKPWKPLEKKKLFRSKHLTLLREFNLNLYPSSFAFVMDVNRYYSERLLRDITGEYLTIDTAFQKRFSILRTYDLRWDITKGLKLQYSATNTGQIREPDGKIDNEQEKDTIRNEIKRGGTTTTFNQTARVDYTIPINKIPIFDWITANAGYSASFNWERPMFAADTLGRVLQNTQGKTLNTQMNMVNFYNKVKYFKKVNAKFQKKNAQQPTTGKGGKTPPKANADTTKKKEKDQNEITILDYLARTLMMVRNASFSVTNNQGTTLPGYTQNTNFFGMASTTPYQESFSPGLGFVLGGQNPDIHTELSSAGLMTTANHNTAYLNNYTLNYNGRVNVEPINNFKIEFTANRNYSKNRTMFYVFDPLDDMFEERNVAHAGNFSMSFLSWRTAFSKLGKKDFSYDPFTQFKNMRAEMSALLAGDYGNSTGVTNGFYNGYGATSQQVMMFSFLAGYGGYNAGGVSRNVFPTIPKPNWRITYDGLSKVKALQKLFKTVTLSHAYRSTYSFSYVQNLNYTEDPNTGLPNAFNSAGDFILPEQISTITLSEQFSPLIKVDVTMNNKITANFEIKKDRNIALSLTSSQVTEIFGQEYVIGAGYRIPDVKIQFGKKKKKSKTDSKKRTLKSDLNLKADLSIRRNVTVLRKIVENVTQPTAGQLVLSVKTSADYVISERLNIRLFYDQLITRPVISTSYNSSNTNAGIALRFTL
ncbi:MAG: cell surface protein SprA [Bacteroidia bacterium]|nr:cell surface protein SprA [Bacteroidia bacterium]